MCFMAITLLASIVLCLKVPILCNCQQSVKNFTSFLTFQYIRNGKEQNMESFFFRFS